MSAKKPAAKIKDKSAHSHENVAVKRKPSAEPEATTKDTTPVMDARSSKDRREGDRRQKDGPVKLERRLGERRVKVNRRRQIDPTTCERDYSPEEVEFMSAMDDYKRRSGRMFPTCSEVLEVFKGLGYEKHVDAPATVLPTEPVEVAEAATEQAV